jgi:hypothetical protein
MGQMKQIYWYYSQYYRAIGNPSLTKIEANVQKKSTSFLLSFSQCKDFLQDFGLFAYKVCWHLISCILASGYIVFLIDDIAQNYQAKHCSDTLKYWSLSERKNMQTHVYAARTCYSL